MHGHSCMAAEGVSSTGPHRRGRTSRRWWVAVMSLSLTAVALAQPPSVTVYNQEFAVVRESIRLNLAPGENSITFTDTTAHLEPDSVILRDPTGRHALRILEQSYRADPISQGLLLAAYEGREVDFLQGDNKTLVRGRIVRSGYEPHWYAMQRYGQMYYQRQMAMAYGVGAPTPLVEVDGLLRFSLPGTPLFPALEEDNVLKPTLEWVIESDAEGTVEAELCYVTGGMTWEADYNVVAPEDGDVLEIIGWVTIDNQSGRSFPAARVKLMAGDLSKLQPDQYNYAYFGLREARSTGFGGALPVTEKTFDEYHLYTLDRPTTLRDRQTKQVEFIRAAGVPSERLYVYDGMKIDENRYRGWTQETIRQDRDYGTACNPKVWVMRQFVNSAEAGLGMPLPRGRVRFYRRDSDGQLEFTGENLIDHTPKDETVRVYTGSAFDLVAERRRTNFALDYNANWLDESFEITLRNHKTAPVEVRVVEHLYRAVNWELKEKSDTYEAIDSSTIEFRVTVPPDGERKVTYQVHYSW